MEWCSSYHQPIYFISYTNQTETELLLLFCIVRKRVENQAIRFRSIGISEPEDPALTQT